MKYQNLTGKDMQLPVKQPRSKSGVWRPVNHVVVKDGAFVDLPEGSERFAKGMGLTLPDKAVKSNIGKTEVETKILDEPKESESEESKEEEKSKPNEKELFALSKKEQTKLLKDLGEENIPRYEKARVVKILELQ